MANPLIKKEGYGYGYGYGEAIPLTQSGKRNLIVALLIMLIGIAWLGYKYYVWSENRAFNTAAVEWAMNNPDEAWKAMESVDTRVVDRKYYASLRAKMLIEKDPAAAAVFLESILSSSDGEYSEFSDQYYHLAVESYIRTRNWTKLETLLENAADWEMVNQRDPRLSVARAYLALQKGALEDAKNLVVESLSRNPKLQEALFLRSQLQAYSQNEIERNQARVTLRNYAFTNDADSLNALLLLVTGKLIPEIDSEWQEIVKAIKEHPFLQFYYLTNEPALLREIVAPVEKYDTELSYRLALKVADLGSATEEDTLKLIILSQETNRLEQSEELLSGLVLKNDELKNLLWLKARQSYLKKDFEAALELAQSGIDSEQPQKFLQVLLEMGSPQSEAPNPIKSQALSRLINWEGISQAQWIYASNIIWEIDPSKQPMLKEKALALAQDSPLPMAKFFIDRSLPADAIECLDLYDGEQTVSFLQLRYQANLLREDYSAALETIISSEIISESTKTLARLYIAWKTEEQTLAKDLWDKAFQLATSENTADSFRTLGDLAFANDERRLAHDAYKEMELRSQLTSVPGETLYRFALVNKGSGETQKAKELLDTLMENASPSDQIRLDWAYLSLLIGKDILEAKDTFSQLFELSPQDARLQVGLGLALLKTGQFARAESQISKLSMEAIDDLSDSYQSICYAILLSSGELVKAELLKGKLDITELLPEEIALIEQYTPLSKEEIEIPDLPDDAPLIPRS